MLSQLNSTAWSRIDDVGDIARSLSSGGSMSAGVLRQVLAGAPSCAVASCTGTPRQRRDATERQLMKLLELLATSASITVVVERALEPSPRRCRVDRVRTIQDGRFTHSALELDDTTTGLELSNLLWENDNDPLNAFVFSGADIARGGIDALGAPVAVIVATADQDLRVWFDDAAETAL